MKTRPTITLSTRGDGRLTMGALREALDELGADERAPEAVVKVEQYDDQRDGSSWVMTIVETLGS